MNLTYGSVCSGIEAATVAWHPLGWSPAFFSEIEKFPSAVLAHHYQTTPNRGDMTRFQEWPDAALDVLVGGTPCQSFSVAGLRKGLDDPRGNLMLTFGAIAKRYRPAWLVWENVPGVLSSNGGRDFGTFLGMLGELGYGFAYRVLDAQYFGVAQRRRRVFVVGYLGDGRRAAAVLFERHSLQGHPAPRRETGQSVAGTFGSRTGSGGGFSTDFEAAGGLVPQWPAEVASTLDTHYGDKMGLENQHINGGAALFVPHPTGGCFDVAPIAFPWQVGGTQGMNVETGGACGTLVKNQTQAVAVGGYEGKAVSFKIGAGAGAGSIGLAEELAPTLGAADSGTQRSPGLLQGMAVRRLTPVECERLQGFPDNYTDIRANGKPTPDGPRYKALGNSMAVPVMRWIGERIAQVEAITNEKELAA